MKFRATLYGTGDAMGRPLKVMDVEADSYADAMRKAQKAWNAHPIGVKVK